MTTSNKSVHPSLVMFALATGGFAIGTTEFAAMSLLPYFAPALGIDAPTAGHVISAYALGVVVGAPIIAVAAARMSRRTLLIGLMVFFALGNAFSALAPSYHWVLLARFLSGLPHGAYFGIAALMAAGLVPPNQRAQAVAKVMLGLTIATILGVPAATALGQSFGWRWGFAIVAALALVTAVLVWLYAPDDRPDAAASPLRELGALRNRQVWLTLATGAIGFGGLFAVYTYVGSTMLAVTGASAAQLPLILAIFGIGTTIGMLIGARAADRSVMASAAAMLVWSALALAAYPFAAHNIWTLAIDIFAVGAGGGVAVILQTRLMDVAGDAQALAAALHHCAFNVANALGPWLGGLAIAGGYGWTSTGWVGCGLALGGLAMLGVCVLDERAGVRRRAAVAC